MAKAVQLPSGKWRCQVFLGTDSNGKMIRRSFTAKTKKEAEEMAKKCEVTDKKNIRLDDADMTVEDAARRFIAKKKKELEKGKMSPTTVNLYDSYLRNLLPGISRYPVRKITDKVINDWISDLEEDHSPKTVKNAWSFVRSSLWDVLPHSTIIDWNIQLPAQVRKKVSVPTEADLRKLLKYLKVTDYDLYLAVILAAFGTMRRSELAALTADDVHGNVITVDKALVRSLEGDWVIKGTKTEMSTRDVVMPAFVVNALPTEGKIININPSQITCRFVRTLEKINMPHFRFHDLRHYSASIMHALGATNEIIKARGGWTTDQTINEHYRGNMTEYEAAFTKKLNNHFSKKFVI